MPAVNAICLTPAERERLAALYPPEPEPKAPIAVQHYRRPPPVHHGARPDIRGQHHGMAKLTNELVAELRQDASAGVPCAKMAKRRGLKTSTVLHAVRGASWGWLTNPPPIPSWKGTGVTDAIRKVMRGSAIAEFKVKQLGLDYPDAHIREALHRLLRRGEVERTGKGLYRWKCWSSSPTRTATRSGCSKMKRR